VFVLVPIFRFTGLQSDFFNVVGLVDVVPVYGEDVDIKHFVEGVSEVKIKHFNGEGYFWGLEGVVEGVAFLLYFHAPLDAGHVDGAYCEGCYQEEDDAVDADGDECSGVGGLGGLILVAEELGSAEHVPALEVAFGPVHHRRILFLN